MWCPRRAQEVRLIESQGGWALPAHGQAAVAHRQMCNWLSNSCRGPVSGEERLSCLRKKFQSRRDGSVGKGAGVRSPRTTWWKERISSGLHMFNGMCVHIHSTHICLPMPLLSHTRVMSVHTQYQIHACMRIPFLDYTHHDHVHLVIWPSDVRVASWETAVPQGCAVLCCAVLHGPDPSLHARVLCCTAPTLPCTPGCCAAHPLTPPCMPGG